MCVFVDTGIQRPNRARIVCIPDVIRVIGRLNRAWVVTHLVTSGLAVIRPRGSKAMDRGSAVRTRRVRAAGESGLLSPVLPHELGLSIFGGYGPVFLGYFVRAIWSDVSLSKPQMDTELGTARSGNAIATKQRVKSQIRYRRLACRCCFGGCRVSLLGRILWRRLHWCRRLFCDLSIFAKRDHYFGVAGWSLFLQRILRAPNSAHFPSFVCLIGCLLRIRLVIPLTTGYRFVQSIHAGCLTVGI